VTDGYDPDAIRAAWAEVEEARVWFQQCDPDMTDAAIYRWLAAEERLAALVALRPENPGYAAQARSEGAS